MSLVLVHNNTPGSDFQIKFSRLPNTFSGGQFGSGVWRYRPEVNEFCVNDYALDNGLALAGRTYFSSKCGNGIVDPGEECDAGFGSPACDHCECQSGFLCSGTFTQELPRLASFSSLLLYGLERVPSNPAARVYAVRADLPALTPGTVGLESIPETIRAFEGYQFCPLIPALQTACEATNTVRLSGVVSRTSPPAVTLFHQSTNLSAMLFNFSEYDANLVAIINGNKRPIYPAPTTTNFVGTSALGCNPKIMYYLSFDSVMTMTVRAIDTETGQAPSGYFSYNITVNYAPPTAVIAVNTSSQDVFVFIHAPFNISASAVWQFSSTLVLKNLNTPWYGPAQGTEGINGATYIPDYDAFGFSLFGLDGMGKKQFAPMRLGWPLKYNNTITRVLNVQYADPSRVGSYQWTIGTDFCCPRQCYSGSCVSGSCSCPAGFSGPSCTDFSISIPTAPTRLWAVIWSPMHPDDSALHTVSGCANPATGSTLIELRMAGSAVPTFSTTIPFNVSRPYVLPAVSLSADAALNGSISNVYCQLTNMPLASLSGDPRYAPFFTFAEIVPLHVNQPLTRVASGSDADFEVSVPSDPIIYRARRMLDNTGSGHSVSISISGGSGCQGSLGYAPIGFPIPYMRLSGSFRGCASSSFFLLGDTCPSNFTISSSWASTDDLYVLLMCSNNTVSNVTYSFVPSPAVSNCAASIMSNVSGVSCAAGTNGSSIFTLTTNVTVPRGMYMAANNHVNLNGFHLNVQGDLLFSGVINTTWFYRPLPNKRSAVESLQNLTLASQGTIGSVSVEGCANLAGSSVNVQIDAASLPPGSSSTSAQETVVTVYPVTYDCASGSVGSHSTTISNENDPCADYKVKSSQASTQPKGLQVLFSFETTPTGLCASPTNGASSPNGSAVVGSEFSAGLIAGIVVAIIGAILVVAIVAYLASPTLRAKLTPYKGTNV